MAVDMAVADILAAASVADIPVVVSVDIPLDILVDGIPVDRGVLIQAGTMAGLGIAVGTPDGGEWESFSLCGYGMPTFL